jgi:hypothetical protein
LNSNDLREQILALIAHNPKGYKEASFRETISNLLQEYASCSPEIDPADIVFVIGAEVYGSKVTFPHHDEETESHIIVNFDYMKMFMKDVFLAYGEFNSLPFALLSRIVISNGQDCYRRNS